MDATDDFGGVITVATDDIAGINAELENYQTTAEAAAEDARFLSDRYPGLATDADKAREKAKAYREELGKQADKIRELTDPVFALRRRPTGVQHGVREVVRARRVGDGDRRRADRRRGRPHRSRPSTWKPPKLAVESGREEDGGRLEPGPGGGGAAGGRHLESKDAIDQWSTAVNNAPRWHPGTGTGGRSRPPSKPAARSSPGALHGGGGGT